MQQLIGNNYGSYSFNPAAQTITIAGIDDILTLEQIQVITNVTTNTIIYAFAVSGKGGDIVDNVLTLDFDTTSMSTTDKLAILVNTPSRDTELLKTLYRIQKLLEPMGHIDPATAAQKVAVANTVSVSIGGGTLPTVTAVTGITNRITANVDMFNGIDPRFLLQEQNRASFSFGVRSKMSFT